MLVGLPGSGKSTVGKLLAQRLGFEFLDVDPLIEKQAGLSIADIFAQKGEAEFRRLESELTARLASKSNLVLAPGGGWILRNTLPASLMVWLQVDPAEAIRRMGPQLGARPLLRETPEAALARLLAEREAYYERADIHIDTNGRTADAVVDAVAVAIENHGNQKEG